MGGNGRANSLLLKPIPWLREILSVSFIPSLWSGNLTRFVGLVDNVLPDWFSENGAGSTPSDRKFHLLLNLAIGGRFPGPPDLMTSFPAQMVVDYVRVYQKRES